MSEANVIASLIEFLLYKGCLVIRFNSGAAMPDRADGSSRFVPFNRWQILGQDEEISGVSDLFALTPAGVWLIIEAKDIGKRADIRPSQQRFIAECAARGVKVLVAECIEDVEQELLEASQ